MSFVEAQFPADISYGSKGGSGFNTSVFQTVSGQEQRNVNWSKSKGEWDIGYGVRNVSDMDAVVNFFMAMQGKAYAFRFKDWADYTIVNQQIGIGDGVTNIWQLVKVYGVGSQSFTRPIYKPVPGTLGPVLVNGSPVAAAYTGIDSTTGIIYFSAGHIVPAGQAIVVTYCEFDVPARFDVDKLDVSQDSFNAENWQGIRISEVRL